MAEPKKQVPLRLNAKLYDALAAWAEDDFRSVNGQIEYLLTECVRQRKKNGKYVSDQLDVPPELDLHCCTREKSVWSAPQGATNANDSIWLLHKTSAAAFCLSGKAVLSGRKRGQMSVDLIYQLSTQCSGISSKKATKATKRS